MAATGSRVDEIVAKFLSLALLGVTSGIWFVAVNNNVLEPYLDEYFHIRQAVEYWKGNWHVWDPKITTPPGLYIVSWPWLFFLYRSKVPAALMTQLRAVNQFLGIPGIFQLLPGLLERIYVSELGLSPHDVYSSADNIKNSRSGSKDTNEGTFVAGIWETTRNITFFPPLFFFSALYYTDVLSVLVVLYCYRAFHSKGFSWATLPLGLLSLWFRQNSIFWCAIYLAGLEVVSALKRAQAGPVRIEKYADIPAILQRSWMEGVVFDPTVDVAGIEDYVVSALTLAIAAIANPVRVLTSLIPYITLLAAFVGFVIWNGSVVLGDKSNHVASLHLPQMLYIWAYLTFFTFPVIALSILSKYVMAYRTTKSHFKTILAILPNPLLLILSLGLAAAAVHFNTIIHPFTLADNRHYTFYVFRILRLYPRLRYAAVPLYVVCGWLCISALGTGRTLSRVLSKQANPSLSSAPSKSKTKIKTAASINPASDLATGAGSNRVSFVLVWLISSALGLVTAPLVEPRYFILPWIVWRLHVPPAKLALPLGVTAREMDDARYRAVSWLAKRALMFETVWLLAVNAATMYVFINWGFEWPQERGKMQRFMW